MNEQKKKRWDRKVIETSKQWQFNDSGSGEVAGTRYSVDGIKELGLSMLRSDRAYESGYGSGYDY